MYTKMKLQDSREYIIKKEKEVIPSMSFDPARDFVEQREALEKKLFELLNMPDNHTSHAPIIEYRDASDPRYEDIRFVVETEPGFYVPAHLLLPKEPKGKLPLVICLQGHTEGMHISMAREAYPGKKSISVEGDRDFCIQALKCGYAALAIEQRGFGELAPAFKLGWENSCHHLSWSAVMMGKTLLGDRLHDISAVIDAIEIGFADYIDTKKIGIMGNSGGGTSSYYAMCVDKRISVAMPSSCFCTLVDSWGSLPHCGCAYVPNILKYMEMADLAMLIAPRPLVLVIGHSDPINPLDKTQEAFEVVKQIYAAAGASDNCHLVIGDGGHRFYAKDAWPVFEKCFI